MSVGVRRGWARRSGPGVPQALDSESPPPPPSGPPSAAPVVATVGIGGKASVPASSAFQSTAAKAACR